MKTFWIFILFAFAFYLLGWFTGRISVRSAEPVEISGVVPTEEVAEGMTETLPDTIRVLVPAMPKVPKMETKPVKTEILSPKAEIKPLESVMPGKEYDEAIQTTLADWNTKRSYSGTLFSDKRAGTVTYAFDVQFNKTGPISYNFTEGKKTMPDNRRWGVGVQVGYGIPINGRPAPYIGIGIQYTLIKF